MANTKIRGNTQILDGTIEDAQIAPSTISLSKLVEAVIQADGGQAFTGDQSVGSNKLTSLADGTVAADAVNKGQLDTAIAGVIDTTILTKLVTREIPTGVIDGVNKIFTLAFTPEVGTESVYRNGLLQDEGVAEDYTIVGDTITFISAVGNPAKLRVNYVKQ